MRPIGSLICSASSIPPAFRRQHFRRNGHRPDGQLSIHGNAGVVLSSSRKRGPIRRGPNFLARWPMASAPTSIGGCGSLRAAFAKASAPHRRSPGEALAETGRRDDVARFVENTLPPPRNASRPSYACISRPKPEGAGKAGRSMHPQLRVQKWKARR